MTEPTTPIQRSLEAASKHADHVAARADEIRKAADEHLAKLAVEHMQHDTQPGGASGAENEQ
jgi:hypothetical protein